MYLIFCLGSKDYSVWASLRTEAVYLDYLYFSNSSMYAKPHTQTAKKRIERQEKQQTTKARHGNHIVYKGKMWFSFSKF